MVIAQAASLGEFSSSSGYAPEEGDGYGYGDGYGDGIGDGYSVGGYGDGYGYGNGDGSSYDRGSDHDAGDGYGYGDVLRIW